MKMIVMIGMKDKMKHSCIVGIQFGDEGKGAITERMSVNYDWVIRYSGGDNVGAKVYRNNKPYIHHLLPVVSYNSSKAKSFLASEMVINMPALLEEIKTMQQDFPNIAKNVYVDIDAFVVLPEHIEEDKIVGQKQGTTYRGIRQSYRSKVDRTGTRVYNLINDNDPVIQALKELGVQFTTALQMRETFERSRLLFEGSQSIMLSLTNGLYPFITSSDTTISGVYASGFAWAAGDIKVYGIAKPYITRSGGQKLITEMPEEQSEVYVEKGNEIGGTTGRKRGIGFLDIPALKYACMRACVDAIIMTKMDIMEGTKSIKICHSYNKEVYSPNDFKSVVPQYTELAGWKNSRNINEVKDFLAYIEKNVGCPVIYYSCGVQPQDLIEFQRRPNATDELQEIR